MIGNAVLAAHHDRAGLEFVRAALASADVTVRQAALHVLLRLPSPVEALRADIEPLLSSDDVDIRRTAAELLIAGEGSSADDVLKVLVQLLAQNHAVGRILRQAGARAAAAVPALQRAVELGMVSAIPVLCEIAPADVSLTALRHALGRKEPAVLAAAADGIATLGQAPESVRARLGELSHSASRPVRLAARSALARVLQI